jgi:hypothetical protein|nr:MAG TPA: hypothetical protein [Caudoviricetes sp.]
MKKKESFCFKLSTNFRRRESVLRFILRFEGLEELPMENIEREYGEDLTILLSQTYHLKSGHFSIHNTEPLLLSYNKVEKQFEGAMNQSLSSFYNSVRQGSEHIKNNLKSSHWDISFNFYYNSFRYAKNVYPIIMKYKPVDFQWGSSSNGNPILNFTLWGNMYTITADTNETSKFFKYEGDDLVLTIPLIKK